MVSGRRAELRWGYEALISQLWVRRSGRAVVVLG